MEYGIFLYFYHEKNKEFKEWTNFSYLMHMH